VAAVEILSKGSHDVEGEKAELLAYVREYIEDRLKVYEEIKVRDDVNQHFFLSSRYMQSIDRARRINLNKPFATRLEKAHEIMDGVKNDLRLKIRESLGKPLASVYKKVLIGVLMREKDTEERLARRHPDYAPSETHKDRMRFIGRQLYFLENARSQSNHYKRDLAKSLEPEIPGLNCSLQEFRGALVAAGMYQYQADKVIDNIESALETLSLSATKMLEIISKPTYFWGSNIKIAYALFAFGAITMPLRDAIVETSKEHNRNMRDVVGSHTCKKLFEPNERHPGFGNVGARRAESPSLSAPVETPVEASAEAPVVPGQ
jgi:hypothetical protein